MSITSNWNNLFDNVIINYHTTDNVDQKIDNPYSGDTLEHLLYAKCWIDSVQWHLEDIIRDPNINPIKALEIKRRIDKSNQDRTDIVEYIDSYFFEKFKEITPKDNAKINSETPAWAIDRLSILALKIYHMNIECMRSDVSDDHLKGCKQKYNVLIQQRTDLSCAINDLLNDIENGDKYMRMYKQMKMYNDPSLNPVLYKK